MPNYSEGSVHKKPWLPQPEKRYVMNGEHVKVIEELEAERDNLTAEVMCLKHEVKGYEKRVAELEAERDLAVTASNQAMERTQQLGADNHRYREALENIQVETYEVTTEAMCAKALEVRDANKTQVPDIHDAKKSIQP